MNKLISKGYDLIYVLKDKDRNSTFFQKCDSLCFIFNGKYSDEFIVITRNKPKTDPEAIDSAGLVTFLEEESFRIFVKKQAMQRMFAEHINYSKLELAEIYIDRLLANPEALEIKKALCI